MKFFEELKRRNVFRVAIGYIVTAWLLLQVVDLVLENVNAPDWVMQVFMLALAVGFPLAVFFAWAFELTPEGVKREADVDRTQSIASQTGRSLDRAIIGVLTIAVLFLAYQQFRINDKAVPAENPRTAVSADNIQTTEEPGTVNDDTAASENEKSIAVLPLANRSVQAEDAFFAEGLHDELLTQLSRISALRVISRTSVMGYARTTKRIPEIASELGVATLLEGGVQRAGNRVRINVQLIEASTDEHLWAEVYDRELTTDNLFDIESDITRSIANALQAVLTGEEQQSLDQKITDNVEAYAYYLRGRATSKAYGRQPDDIERSIGYYQSAIELDPDFAAAYASLAIDWTEQYWISERLGDELEHAQAALSRAKSLAPGSPDTLIAEGYYHYWGRLDYATAIAAFDKALQKEPGNYLALRGKAYALRRDGQLDESIKVLEKVVSLDPLFAEILSDLGYTLLRTGRYDEANVILDRSLALGAESSFVHWIRAESLLMRGDLDEAWQEVESIPLRSRQIGGFYTDARLLIARALGDDELVDNVLDSYRLADAQSLGPEFSQALVYLDRGEMEELGTLIREMQEELLVADSERPNAEATLIGFVQLHALQKDKKKLAEAVDAFYDNIKPDALRIIDRRTIPIAFAIAGDSEALMEYLEDLVMKFGPWEFYYFTIDPSFNSQRHLPRFQALESQYHQWLEQQQ
jgi:TolB-like protein